MALHVWSYAGERLDSKRPVKPRKPFRSSGTSPNGRGIAQFASLRSSPNSTTRLHSVSPIFFAAHELGLFGDIILRIRTAWGRWILFLAASHWRKVQPPRKLLQPTQRGGLVGSASCFAEPPPLPRSVRRSNTSTTAATYHSLSSQNSSRTQDVYMRPHRCAIVPSPRGRLALLR